MCRFFMLISSPKILYHEPKNLAFWSLKAGITLKFGIDNLFDKDLPYGTTGTTAGSAAYDNVGRFYYTSLSYSF